MVNNRETWKILKSVTGSSTGNTFPTSFVINNKLILNKNDIVNGLNNFFSNIGPEFAKNIPSISNKHFTDYLGTSIMEYIFLSQVCYSEILIIVSRQKCRNCFVNNGLNMLIIKRIISVLEAFMHICNLSFSKGIFPQQMKIAKVIPICKSGDKSQFNNHHPISVLFQF